MTADISPEARGALKAELASLDDEARPARLVLNRISLRRHALLDAHGLTDDPATCLGCECLILPGDKAQDEASGEIFCEECAYTYAEIKAQHDECWATSSFGELDPEHTIAFAEAYAIHIVAGGSPDDKPLYVCGED